MMESFQASGEEIERALRDLGPLLGVSIKEEAPDELADSAPTNAASEDGSSDPKTGEGADSLASPAARGPAAERCVLCGAALLAAPGTPKLMECLHSACEPCLKAKIDEKQNSNRDFLGAERITITCPACRLQCQPANMVDQRFVLELMSADQASSTGPVSGSQQCNSCGDGAPATSYCTDCADYICTSCVQAHQRLKITKEHTIKSREEALQEQRAAAGAGGSRDIYCTEHPQERLTLFCETCDRLTCRDCQLKHHRDHKYQFSSEMAAQARCNISSLLSEVSYKRVLLGSAMKVIAERQALIADKKKALVRDITSTVVKLTNAINTRGKQLVLRLNAVCDSKQQTLAEKKQALEQLASITEHCVSTVTASLEQGSDTAVLYSKRAICAHLHRIKSRRADIPNPDIPVRISLALDKLPELVKVLSTIGAIVVDGKVDGAAGGAQGPYHPPPAPPAPPAAPSHPATPPAQQSAVVALQHAAMQQSFASHRSSGSQFNMQLHMRRNPPALRHPHVTSTTHPHMHGMNELNLRGLLNQAGLTQAGLTQGLSQAGLTQASLTQGLSQAAMSQAGLGARALQASRQNLHHQQQNYHYQQMMAQYGGGAYPQQHPGRLPAPRTPSPAPPAPAAPPASHGPKWHIPQHHQQHGGSGYEPLSAASGMEYKITLARPAATPPATPPAPAAVTSTNPKTPSPSLNGGLGGAELDKVCAASVQDLMATIAKLDSNGVQVLAETPDPCAPDTSTSKPATHTNADPNEDWCAVCMDGGELMCCDRCPKVFHQYCHLPTIDQLPGESETWQCLLCVNFAELPPDPPRPPGAPAPPALTPRQLKIIERLTLELYCQYEPSLPFREPVSADNTDYYSKISSPMCLDMIRGRLQGGAARYTALPQYLRDVRLLFRNAYLYNPPDSQIYKDAKRLEEFFDAQLVKLLPEYAYWQDSDGDSPPKRARYE